MLALLDNLFPWFGDMLELGGDILLMIIIIASLMWAFIFERLLYFHWVLPRKRKVLTAFWQQSINASSDQLLQLKGLLVSRMSRDMNRNLELIRTLVKVCPLLGLLGTVLGMLEIFDALAITGNNSARTTAGGVSKATVSTMAGMVVALSGLMISNYLINKSAEVRLAIKESLELPNKNGEIPHA